MVLDSATQAAEEPQDSPEGTAERSPGRQSWEIGCLGIQSRQGRLKCLDTVLLSVRDDFQPSLRGWIIFSNAPGLTSWVTLSRPFGTVLEFLPHTVRPVASLSALLTRNDSGISFDELFGEKMRAIGR